MKSRYLKAALFFLVFLLGFGLRLWKYPFYPFAGHAEEYLFVWSGLSLIEKGVPISWNDLPVYEKKNIYFEGIAPNPTGGGLGVRLLKPWLDEPPLFSLIVGGIAKLYNFPNFTIISPYVIRIPSLLFSAVSLIFVFLIAEKFFGYGIGLGSMLFYGIIPTVVFGSRLAVPENLITSLMLVCLWLITGYLESKQEWKRNLAIFLAALAGLAKPTGYLLVPFVSFFVLKEKKWKEGIGMLLAGSLLFWLPFLGYGYYFDWNLFKKIIAVQSLRPAGWSSLSYIITNPGFSIEIFLDSLIIIGFISLFYLAFKKERDKNETTILFSFLFALLVTMISGGKHDQLTWYRYPIYPFMAISAVLLLKEVLNNPSFYLSAIMIPLLAANIDLIENPFWKWNYLIQSGPFRLVLFLFLLPSILNMIFKSKLLEKISRFVLILLIILMVGINILVVKSRFNILCDHTHCPLPEKINLFRVLTKIK